MSEVMDYRENASFYQNRMSEVMDDRNNVSSPECLMTSEPVKDPYSTDEENSRPLKKLKKPESARKSTEEEKTPIQINDLETCFNVNFCNRLPNGPINKKIMEMDTFASIDKLIYFTTQQNKITAKEVVTFALNAPGSECIQEMYNNDIYRVNLKQPCLIPDLRSMYPVSQFICRQSIQDLHCMFVRTSDCMTDVRGFVRQYLYQLAAVLNEGFLTSGVYRHTLHVPRGKCRTDATNCFTSTPDVAIGRYEARSPIIPVHVVNRSVYNKEQGDQPANHRETADLTVHMLASAIQYTGMNCCLQVTNKVHKLRAFLGLSVQNEHVHIGKIIGTDVTFRDFEVPDTSPYKEISASYRGDIHVEFCDMVFDLSFHCHRMALLLFLKYYLCNWENMEVKFEI